MPLLSVLNESDETPEAAVRAERAAASDQFSLAHTLLRLASEHHRHNVRVRIADFGALELQFDERSFRADFPLTSLPRCLHARRYVVTAINPRAEAAALSCAHGRISDLFWIAARDCAADLRLPDDVPLKLAQWPNFPRLPHSVEHIQLCGLLAGHALSPREIREHSALPRATVDSFLAAALAAGFVERCSDDELLFAPPPQPMARGGLLHRLLARFGF